MDKQQIYRQVAVLHAANLDQGFLATIGVDFLALMYRAIDEARDSVLLFEECDGRVVGFVSGGVGMGAIYRRMLRRPVSLAKALLPSLLHPKRVRKIFDVLRYSRASAGHNDLPRAELLSIAVDGKFRGQGIAEVLYRRLVEHFAEGGILVFKIVVGSALEPAHRFYTRMGAIPAAEVEVHAGQRSSVYVHSFRTGKLLGNEPPG